NRDKVDGGWRMENGELIGTGGYARLAFNSFQTPEEYDFRIQFTCKVAGNSIGQHLSRGGKDVMWLMGGFCNSASGLEQIGGAKANVNATTLKRPFENGRRYESLV